MISEGFPGTDNVYTLKDGVLKYSHTFSRHSNKYRINAFGYTGILRLELPKDVLERTGLTGRPIKSGGRKHTKERYCKCGFSLFLLWYSRLTFAVVELNLRLPSMLHGKKGFERIVWAFENVLNESVAWLFCDQAPQQNGWDFLIAKISNNSNIIKMQRTSLSKSINLRS